MQPLNKYEVTPVNQIGTVTEVLMNRKAKVLMKKHSACGDCGACQHGKENMKLKIIAANEISAHVGDMVEVDMETQHVLGAAFIVYVIPLFFLIAGVVSGNYFFNEIGVSNSEIYSALAGFILMGLSFVVIRTFEKSFQGDKKYLPTITKIIH